MHAGHRRYRALKLLSESGRPYNGDLIPCLIEDPASFEWTNVVENVRREDVPLWHLGFRFSELQDQGFTQSEIAARINSSQGFISRCISLSHGLHPSTIKRLDGLRPGALSPSDLAHLSRLTDKRLYPDEKAQDAYLTRIIKRGPVKKARGRHAKSHKDFVYRRFQALKTNGQFKLPSHLQPVVERIVEYLDGTKNRLKFD